MRPCLLVLDLLLVSSVILSALARRIHQRQHAKQLSKHGHPKYGNDPFIENWDKYSDSALRNYQDLTSKTTKLLEKVSTSLEKHQEQLVDAEREKESLSEENFDKRIKDYQFEIEALQMNFDILHQLNKETDQQLKAYRQQKKNTESDMRKAQDEEKHLSKVIRSLGSEIEENSEFAEEAKQVQKELKGKISRFLRQFSVHTVSDLENGWEVQEDRPVKYRLAQSGVVYLQGVVENGQVSYSGSGSILQLDESIAPESSPVLSSLAEGVVGRLDVSEDGHLLAVSPNSPKKPSWFSLDGLHFVPNSDFTHKLSPHTPFKHSRLHPRLSYLQTREGAIHLRGTLLIDEDKSLRVSDHEEVLITTLPEGARPNKWVTLGGIAQNELARIDVFPDGKVMTLFPLESSWFSLDGLSFLGGKADTSQLELTKPWKSFSEQHSQPEIVKSEDEIVHVGGVVVGSTKKGKESVICRLDKGFRPEGTRIFKAIGENELFQVTISGNGNVSVLGKEDSKDVWVSLDGISYFTGHENK